MNRHYLYALLIVAWGTILWAIFHIIVSPYGHVHGAL